MRKPRKAQSAMEYLMTYGWAIVVIAVVLLALYQFGIFNPASFSPKVGAGACKVARSTTYGQIVNSRVGTCNNALPQYVASFTGSSYAQGGMTQITAGTQPATVTLWFKLNALSGVQKTLYGFGNGAACSSNGFWIGVSTTNDLMAGFCGDDYTSSGAVAAGSWNFAAFSYSGSGTSVDVYLNGVHYSGTVAGAPTFPTPQTFSIGGNEFSGGTTTALNGYVSNIQVYNSSLSANEINVLYKGGLGADPININNLVGWWQLNGNPADYSGNGNDATSYNGVTYSGSWTSGYTAPA